MYLHCIHAECFRHLGNRRTGDPTRNCLSIRHLQIPESGLGGARPELPLSALRWRKKFLIEGNNLPIRRFGSPARHKPRNGSPARHKGRTPGWPPEQPLRKASVIPDPISGFTGFTGQHRVLSVARDPGSRNSPGCALTWSPAGTHMASPRHREPVYRIFEKRCQIFLFGALLYDA